MVRSGITWIFFKLNQGGSAKHNYVVRLSVRSYGSSVERVKLLSCLEGLGCYKVRLKSFFYLIAGSGWIGHNVFLGNDRPQTGDVCFSALASSC